MNTAPAATPLDLDDPALAAMPASEPRECAVVAGGRTALEVPGFGHYASSGPPAEVHLYGDEVAPGWARSLSSLVSFWALVPVIAAVLYQGRRT